MQTLGVLRALLYGTVRVTCWMEVGCLTYSPFAGGAPAARAPGTAPARARLAGRPPAVARARPPALPWRQSAMLSWKPAESQAADGAWHSGCYTFVLSSGLALTRMLSGVVVQVQHHTVRKGLS